MSNQSGVAKVLGTLAKMLYGTFLLIIAPVYVYLNLPVINMWFSGVPVGIFLISLFIIFIELRSITQKRTILFKLASLMAVLMIFYIMVMSVATWEGFRSQAYRGLIGEIKIGESFAKDVAPISTDKIRIVDQDVAHRLGDKVLGEQPALGSQVIVGDFRIQKVKDQLYWVAPLLHSGFFKWLNKTGGTPAYVMVSATNERDVKLVTQVNGKDIRIKYQPEAYFGSYLPRHLYFKGFFTTGLTDYTFEIDDEGHPYWVVTLYTHEIGFSGSNAYGIAVVDAETGEVKEYGIDDAPEWVDRIQPMEMVQKQLDYWGEYVNGYWNFANLDKLTTTDGMSLVYGEDNKSYWYTGLTSVGRDQGTVGFLLVDTRTKESTWYKQIGATEQAARSSAMGKVQEKGYISSFPIMYNINGVPTYVMSLKDQAGLIKMIAMVSVEDYSIVGVGDNLKEAMRTYKDAYNSSGGNTIFTSKTADSFSKSGRVIRFKEDVVGGNSYYYFTIEGVSNKIFLGSSSLSNEVPLTMVGDSVQVWYEDGRSNMIDVSKFDNFELEIQQTQTQEIK